MDLLWVFTASGIFRRLVRRRGWTRQTSSQTFGSYAGIIWG